MTGNNKILISGITGFIGSNIALHLLKAGYSIIAIYRNKSDKWRCTEFLDKIIWINIDEIDWDIQVVKLKPEILIHSAWDGLNSIDRNDWKIQNKNFEFSVKLFQISVAAGVRKIISFGSQAEYGVFSGRINEEYLPVPADAYGSTKLHTANYLRLFCISSNVSWYWLRVFSVFGPMENKLWLIPQVIINLLKNNPIDLTKCDQSYDYLYIDDFIKKLEKVILYEGGEVSGIYNLCSGISIKLKDLLTKLAEIIEVPQKLLKFGAVPYRTIQSMHMEGDCSKFNSAFGEISCLSFDQSLREIVNYYKK